MQSLRALAEKFAGAFSLAAGALVIEIDVRADIVRLARWLTDIERRQLPYATSRALNATAFAIRRLEVERVGPRSFDLRDARFLRAAIVVARSHKRRLVATVYDRLRSSDLHLHAEGGIRYPYDGEHVAVPTRALVPKRGARGVPKHLRPRAVMRQRRAFRQRIRGREYILRRNGRRRYPIETLYLLVRSARMRAVFPFYATARGCFRDEFPQEFARNFRRAIRTAR